MSQAQVRISDDGLTLPLGFTGTANAIAAQLGYSKANQRIKNAIADGLASGVLTADESGRYIIYTVVGQQDSGSSRRSASRTMTREEALQVVRIDEDDIPEEDLVNRYGYSVTFKKVSGEPKIVLKTSDNKKLIMDVNEKLVIINGKPLYVVSSAAEMAGCIWKYVTDNNLSVYTVTDLLTSEKIQGPSDIDFDDRIIISMKIEKHNKAA